MSKTSLSGTVLTPRKAPRQRRALATHEAIVGAAAEILTHQGYAGLNTNHIAAAAGVSIGSVYQYFPNKHALVAAVRAKNGTQMTEIVRAHFGELDTAEIAEVIRRLVRASIAVHHLDPELHRVLKDEVPTFGPIRRHDMTGDWVVAELTRVFGSRRAELTIRDPALAAELIVNFIESSIHRLLGTTDPADLPALEDEMVLFVVRYLCSDRTL
jgi:AcrR family transcriptional regulator